MRDGGLVERLDSAVTVGQSVAVPLHRLDDVARALRAVTERTASLIGTEAAAPVEAMIAPVSSDDTDVDSYDDTNEVVYDDVKDDLDDDLSAAEDDDMDREIEDGFAEDVDEHDAEMPQILQYPPSTYAGNEREPAARAHAQAVAPAVLALSVIAVGVLMTASFADISRVPGLAFLSETPRPRLSAPVPSSTVYMAAFEGPASPEHIVKEPGNPQSAPALSLDELALLERCEGLIAAGEIQEARLELAKAASAGSLNARFALAETFDPNVLAAWGLRDRVADAGTARVLYEQAFDAGDLRAETRLAALRDIH